MSAASDDALSDQSKSHDPIVTHITEDSASVEVCVASIYSDAKSNSDEESAEMAEIVENTGGGGGTIDVAAPPVNSRNIQTSPRIRCLRNIFQLEVDFEAGYDSDGQCGPFVNMEEVEGQQIFHEMEMVEKIDGKLKDSAAMTNDENIENDIDKGDDDDSTEEESQHVSIAEDDLLKMKREEIKEQLRLRGQRLTGNKAEMLLRLRNALKE